MDGSLVLALYLTLLAVGYLVYVQRGRRRRVARFRFLARRRDELEERLAHCEMLRGQVERLREVEGMAADATRQAEEALRDYLLAIHPQMQELENLPADEALTHCLAVDRGDLREVRIELEAMQVR
jgi:hypothetical protein